MQTGIACLLREMYIVIDTNAILYAAKAKLDIFEELKGNKLVIPSCVLGELKLLEKNAKKEVDRKAASLSLLILRKKAFLSPNLSPPADNAILDWAKEKGAAILTNDAELKSRAKALGIKVLWIKEKRICE